MSINFETDVGRVRLLLGDIDEDGVAGGLIFTDDQLRAFLSMEGDNVKLAAAQAIEVNATDQALASKVLKAQDFSTDGAKVAMAMLAQAKSLRDQVALAIVTDDEGYFEIVEPADAVGWPRMGL